MEDKVFIKDTVTRRKQEESCRMNRAAPAQADRA